MKINDVFSLESPHRADSNEYTQHTIFIEDKKISLKCPHLPPDGAMISPLWLEITMSRKNFHGPKDGRAIEVRLVMLASTKCQTCKRA